jgi:predicted phage tail protein
MERNRLPNTKTAVVTWADTPNSVTTQEVFDMTSFCTNRDQAVLVARYLLSLRRRITHSVSFQTLPTGLNVAPGAYIRVITQSAPSSGYSNGVFRPEDGVAVTVDPLEDGVYNLSVYSPEKRDTVEQQVTIENGAVTDTSLYGALFTVQGLTVEENIYKVEVVEMDESGLVKITASHYPTENGASVIATDVLSPDRFEISE